MQPIPRFWEKVVSPATDADGKPLRLTIWGWSTTSLGHAREVAGRRLAETVARLAAGARLGRYYPRMPLREQTLQEFHGTDGTLIAATTRNRYGAEVLNTDRVLIADVDLPQAPTPLVRAGGLLRRLLGAGTPGPEPAADPAALALNRVRAFDAAHPELGAHVYRTAAGLRVVITGTAAAPDSPEADRILQELAADPVYVRLCATHKTYRARLTPKPWRCGAPRITITWPYPDQDTAERTEAWIRTYRQRSRPYATCHLIERLGATPGRDEGLILDIHDRATVAGPEVPLA
ncbi:hypothetical protein EXU48_15885 [Occultella glacieicola]|uniref:Uncharacterized protein n=1 Tax=Occultella glacieicola TaxID=2518684 RepID=A0ABY2E285_9MICO|nr:hypothetical protein [Occultella glacieicola]TDE91621.1 hypothetical protein EXU48_15885 [Occultella glacieicola]